MLSKLHACGRPTLAATLILATIIGSVILLPKEARADDCLLDSNNNGTATAGVDTQGGAISPDIADNILACGFFAQADSFNGTALGYQARAVSSNTTAVGAESQALGNGAIALGSESLADGLLSIAIGADGDGSGFGAMTEADGAMAIGVDAHAEANDSIALGRGASTDLSATNSIAFGTGASTDFHASDSIAIGTNAAIGDNADNGIALGAGANVGDFVENGIAIGNQASASGNESVAIGNGASSSTFTNSVALGAGTVNTANNQVHVGDRVVSGVAAGNVSATSSDAVTGQQLFVTNQNVTANTTAIASIQSANSVFDTRIDTLELLADSLDERIGDVDDRASAGTAAAVALSGAMFLPGKSFNLTGNIGTYRGAHAAAVQFGALVSDRVALNAGVAHGFNKGSKTALRAGFTIGW